jgi:hypothetical protein
VLFQSSIDPKADRYGGLISVYGDNDSSNPRSTQRPIATASILNPYSVNV